MDHGSYASPFSWRYGRAELRELFSERERRRLWRAVWVALARSQERSGLVSASEVTDLEAHANDVDIDADSDSNQHANGQPNEHSDANPDSDRDSHPQLDPHRYRDTHGDDVVSALIRTW